MYRRGAPLGRSAVLGPPSARRCNSQSCTQHFVYEQTVNERKQVASANAVDDFYDTDDEIADEMLLIEEFREVLDLSQTDISASPCSTESETDTYQEQLSPDLFPPDQEDIPLDLPIPSTSKHTESFQSSTNASVEERNNNFINPGALTLARRKVLAKLARTRQIEPNMTLYEDTIQPGNDQMFTLCTMTSLSDLWKEPKGSSSVLGRLKLDNMAQGHSSSPIHYVLHSRQDQALTEPDLTVSDNITEQKLVAGLAQMTLLPGQSRPQVSAAVNAELETTEPAQMNWTGLRSRSASPDLAKPGCSYHQALCPVPSRGEKTPLDAQATIAVKPASPDTTNTDEHLDTIVDNVHRSLLVNNIDIYRNIHRGPLPYYQLHEVPFQYVIVTGVITGKAVARNSITQLEVDDGTAVVNCLFDDLQGLPEHRNNFHKYLDSCTHNLPVSGTDAQFDETFHFMREYAKRLFQETPQSDELNLGDEVTIVGKVYDSKNEGRVIYHKHLWRRVDLASRDNCDYVQHQFAKQGRHF